MRFSPRYRLCPWIRDGGGGCGGGAAGGGNGLDGIILYLDGYRGRIVLRDGWKGGAGYPQGLIKRRQNEGKQERGKGGHCLSAFLPPARPV